MTDKKRMDVVRSDRDRGTEIQGGTENGNGKTNCNLVWTPPVTPPLNLSCILDFSHVTNITRSDEK